MIQKLQYNKKKLKYLNEINLLLKILLTINILWRFLSGEETSTLFKVYT